MVNTCSIGSRKGLSFSRFGIGTESIASSNSSIFSIPILGSRFYIIISLILELTSSAQRAEPLTIGVLSPSNP
ncbi:unnamed protein product [Schistosoma mattheei]|uniref:Uncharacterized protein n=1 Tax=Schistosoma mattheei TaxID=31246 RepID=A0A183PVF0_9TREM|nr:unnamed protein product [Schistosoma mattheei]